MANECRCCGGRCGEVESSELNRRDFLEKLAVGAAALTVTGQMAWADEGDKLLAPATPPSRWLSRYPLTPRRVYRGKHLEAVGMPLGGIGTGSIWLNGQGQLGVWQIFNNLSEPRVPDSFLAVRAKAATGPAVTRVLQTQGEGSLRPVQSLDYEGGYPIARLTFHDAALPVEVVLEATNPMIPLDTANSSIPCALLRLTAKNPGNAPVEVAFSATLQNAVGNGGAAGLQGVRLGGYGGNRNRVVRGDAMTVVAMDKTADPVASGPVKIRTAAGKEVHGPELFWLSGLSDLTAVAVEPLARIAAEGGVVLADGVSPQFFHTLAKLRGSHANFDAVAEVFDDFEGKTYEGWTIVGDAFGKGPSHGTEPGQQTVSGFSGHGLVNTFVGGDGPQGTATSRSFRIQRPYIGFLIGGGGHVGKTCINLRVDGKVVRTATGKNRETLEPASWDVADLKGREAVLEIVDHSSEGWGHINIDRIIFSDIPPEPLLSQGTTLETVVKALPVGFTAAEEATLPTGGPIGPANDAGFSIHGIENLPFPPPSTPRSFQWKLSRYTRLSGFHSGEHGYRALATLPDGAPLVIEGPLGKGKIILALAPGLPWDLGSELLASRRGEPLRSGERLVPGSPNWGSMALTAFDARAVALCGWASAEEIAAFISDPQAKAAASEAVSKPGETVNAALAVPFTLSPGESRSAEFAITWHFPNVERFRHSGNLYSRRWPDAAAVAGYLAKNLAALWQRTQLYHATLYQSNLPEEFLDAMASQSVILRGPTCFWSEDGYFGGFEGSYGCCPLNCTHVWNYAQAHARLFPDVGRNMRISNFITYLHPDGETSHREHDPNGAFIDGHCACIEAAYREYQLSPDRRLLERIWPGVKKSVDWLIQTIDRQGEGVPHGHQANTYDTSVSGANTFIGSQYLAALAAAERMALVMNDPQSARRWRTVRLAGMKNQDQKLWNGEYYIQIPEPQPARDYNTGCHADQLLGQWWAHMLNLGYLYPAARVKGALEMVMKHNFREKFAGFKQAPRRYIPDDEGGL
ncbi:MAG: GH116 family glycosyl-hydrolase, partial [Thermoguttaceae bacterium]